MTTGRDTATRQAETHALFEAGQRNPPVLNGRGDVPGSPDVLTHDRLAEGLCEGYDAERLSIFCVWASINTWFLVAAIRTDSDDPAQKPSLAVA